MLQAMQSCRSFHSLSCRIRIFMWCPSRAVAKNGSASSVSNDFFGRCVLNDKIGGTLRGRECDGAGVWGGYAGSSSTCLPLQSFLSMNISFNITALWDIRHIHNKLRILSHPCDVSNSSSSWYSVASFPDSRRHSDCRSWNNICYHLRNLVWWGWCFNVHHQFSLTLDAGSQNLSWLSILDLQVT